MTVDGTAATGVRRQPVTLAGGTAAAALLLACITFSGCATPALWRKVHERPPLTSIRLTVLAAGPDGAEVGWRARFPDLPDETGTLAIGPAPRGCDTIEVLVARRSGPPVPLTQRARRFSVGDLGTPLALDALWAEVVEPACAVLLVFRRSGTKDRLAVTASWIPQASTTVDTIEAPRPHAWQAVFLPATVVADTAAVGLVVPALLCLGDRHGCSGTLGSLIPGNQNAGTTTVGGVPAGRETGAGTH